MYNYIFMKNIPIIIFPIITFKCIHIYYDWLILLVSWLSSHLSACNLIPLTYIPHDVHLSINFFYCEYKNKD